MSDERSLAPAWIVVIVLSVVVAAQSMYIYLQWRGRREHGGARRPERQTQWFDLRSRDLRSTGYSPIEPPTARHHYRR